MIPDNVEKIIMTKEDYDRNVEQLLLEKINAEQEIERLHSIIKEAIEYIYYHHKHFFRNEKPYVDTKGVLDVLLKGDENG